MHRIGAFELGDRGVTEAEFRSGLPYTVQGRRGAGLQDPAQHRAVQVTGRRGQRRLPAGGARPAGPSGLVMISSSPYEIRSAGQAARQDSFVPSRLNDWAGSRSASDMVRYGAHVPAGSDTVVRARIA